ncbi:MAG: transglycosylase SLT domain-containing protein [Deltaproteobacteria bacterium]|nr:transglycosylase SLT domain-containing protein [Deltaproteobacteria bacterium]
MPIFTPPSQLSFCGERLPLDKRHGREMLDREFTIVVYNHPQVILWLKRSRRYLPFFSQQLHQAGLPDDLKYLPVIESSLLENIHSRAGAAGLWQFMKHTGKRQGLRITADLDERLDPLRSTQAAISYLAFLKEKFGTWALALAAYNCGEKRVSAAISMQQANSYYHLSLPAESERYLYRLAAIKLIITNPDRYGFRIPADQYYQPLPNHRVTLNLKQRYRLTDFAKGLGTTYHTLKKLNPQFISTFLPRGRFTLLLPQNCRQDPMAIIRTLPPQPAAAGQRFYTVKPGDTLGAISRRFHIPTARLRRLNRLSGSKIMIGQKLRLRE